jgi:hypothetical protein
MNIDLSTVPPPRPVRLLAFNGKNIIYTSSFLGSTVQLRPWPPPQNPAEFLGGFSKIFFFAG